jgi:hypothetical protein
MEDVASFQHVHLDQIDPSFAPIEDGYYNLKLLSAEYREFDKTATGGKAGEFIKFGFAIQDDPKFSGRRVWPQALFPNNFVFKVLRLIQDATGIAQNGDMKAWLVELGNIQPTLKLKVYTGPDVRFDGTPNPHTVKADGTPGDRTDIDWKAGVQPGD